jgi:inorganic triphosphatase YgiF
MSRGQEIELKLEVDDAGAQLLRNHPLLNGHRSCSQKEVSTYFDTDECALKKAGFSLRVRQTDDRYVQTIKQQRSGSAGLFERPEWEQQIAAAEVDLQAAAETPLRDILTKKIRDRLEPLVKSDVERTVWSILRGGSEVELTLDEGTITGGQNSQPLVEVEIELKEGNPISLIEVARELAGQVPLRLGVLTKAERGFALANGASGKAAKAEPVLLRPEMNAAEGFAAIAGACLRHYRLNEGLVVRARDPEALHQSRVAMRRMRSAFSLFRPVIGDDEYGRLRKEVRWFTSQLGEARNLDVLLRRLPRDEHPRGLALRKRLERARAEAYDEVLEVLDSARLRRLMLDLVAWMETGEWRRGKQAAEPLPNFAVRRLDRGWRRLKKHGRALAEADPEALHRLRIEVKKLRYAVDFLSSLQGGRSAATHQKKMLSALEEMQEHLGELNDFETARRLLAHLLGSGAEAEAMIRYAERQLDGGAAAEKVLESTDQAYQRLRAVGPFWRR